MNKFLQKIGLIKIFEINLNITRSEFVEKLSRLTEAGSPEMFANPLEALSSGSSEFKGIVNQEGFRIKRKKRIFKANLNLAIAEGKYAEIGRNLTITTEICGLNKFFKFICVFFFIFYLVVAIMLDLSGDANSVAFIPFIFIHAIIVYTILYFILNFSAAKLKKVILSNFESF